MALEKAQESKAPKSFKPSLNFKLVGTQSDLTQVTKVIETSKTTAIINTNKNQEAKGKESKASHNATSPSTRKSRNNFRKLSDAKLARKRKVGLCFKCDEKFEPNHKCKNKTLQMMLLEEDGERQNIDNEGNPEPEEAVAQKPKKVAIELSMNSIVGLTNNHTMNLRGKLRGKQVVILINSEASYNFISYILVERTKPPAQKGREYTISVENGYKVRGDQV